jgi:hypothetical protein
MKAVLIIVPLLEVALLLLVLVGYLLAIARTLRTTSRTLGLITFGVRAIEKQTEPLGPVLREINGALEQVAGALGIPPAEPRVGERTVDAVEHGSTREVSGGAG